MWVSSAKNHTALPQVIQGKHKALVESLINGSAQTFPADLTAAGSFLHISPVVAYIIDINDTGVPLCLNAEEPCVVLNEFVPRENCTYGLMCPLLEGNVCGSYGIEVSNAEGVEQGSLINKTPHMVSSFQVGIGWIVGFFCCLAKIKTKHLNK